MKLGRLQIDFRRFTDDALSWKLELWMWSKK